MSFHFYLLCSEPVVRKSTWMRAISVTVMVISLKVPFWKILDRSYLTTVFERYLTVEDLQTWISTNVLILSWVLIMKQNRQSCMENYRFYNYPSLYFHEHCTKIEDEISLFIACFFFSQTDLQVGLVLTE